MMLKSSLALAVLFCAGIARADDFGSTLSGPFAITYVAAGVALLLLRDHDQGKDRLWRNVDAMIVTLAATEALKAGIRERRPDGSDHGSFPSAHASLSFAIATMESQYHPNEAIFWYAGATLISASRVHERKHYFHDVLAGAALGYGVARLELSLPHGMILQPLIGSRGERGFTLSGKF
jgi:membrane-associated phospholipid phosphatase